MASATSAVGAEDPARAHAAHADTPLSARLAATARHYWDLGFTSFGGPGVHVVILRKRFVDRLHWVDDKTFTDLFSLGNALPGPGSTQLAFSIAVVRQGVVAGFLAFLMWSLPGAVGMAALAAGVSRIPDTLPGLVLGLLTGLNAAAVGLIALAAVQLAKAAITDPLTRLILWLSASFGICYHAPWMYPTLIAVGGLATLLWDQRRAWLVEPIRRLRRRSQAAAVLENPATEETVEMDVMPSTSGGTDDVAAKRRRPLGERHATNASVRSNGPDDKQTLAGNTFHTSSGSGTAPPHSGPAPSAPSAAPMSSHPPTAAATAGEAELMSQQPLRIISYRTAGIFAAGFVLLLVIPLATRAGLRNAGKGVPRALDFFTNMVIAGTIIFGGGPVVVPLLRDYVVVEGWVSSRDFLLVFAILQAWPGPNFNFAVALGVLAVPQSRVLGAVLGWLGIFSPGIILKIGLLPLYSSWRRHPLVRSVLRGLNAAASGLVFSATWLLFLVGYIYQSADPASPRQQQLSGPLTQDPWWAVVASGSFLATANFHAPPWLSIGAGGLAGMAWYGVQRHQGLQA